ncbi:hypothetical protein M430DRAFT_33207 [Amorphotheca resinae ATCC 22711]|uniref:Uncharacterized protein n=1 Tax=Amorphotheca resinae ATCC 22711 TaxID=857342 RepID=A0A2T3BB90_AMORE|nr:hypothetical protein M430DRAFT_33207 [Amorphotheca resinae ATCC 22711]PSS25534.1 hypothetical protein M430DRAFT_33207 [Amorphotheca resinae ATCC 22711]
MLSGSFRSVILAIAFFFVFQTTSGFALPRAFKGRALAERSVPVVARDSAPAYSYVPIPSGYPIPSGLPAPSGLSALPTAATASAPFPLTNGTTTSIPAPTGTGVPKPTGW